MAEFRGRVTKVHRSTEEWSAGKIFLDSLNREVGFVGSCYATLNTAMILYGEMTTDPKWGPQIKVDSGMVDLTFTAQGLIDYLADEVRFENIGPVRARLLVDRFGVDGLKARADSPARCLELAEIPGVTEETAKGIHAHWEEARAVNELMVTFRSYGLDHSRAVQVVRVLGGKAKILLHEDPYRLIDLAGIPFQAIDKIERANKINKLDTRRVAGALIDVLQRHAKDGHTLMGRAELLDEMKDYCAGAGLTDKHLLEAETYRKGLEGPAPFVIGSNAGGALGTLYRSERDLLEWLQESRKYPSQLGQRVSISEVPIPAELTDQQQAAFRMCLTSSVTWVYGLAGTGKTHSARLICDLYAEKGMNVMLMAPTGKAAKRLSEATDRPAGTIHRSLACKPKASDGKGKLRFSFVGDPIDAQLVIVDEVSMVDSELLAHLIRRIDLKRTSVIFLGDVNQLVPVGPGQPAVDIHGYPQCLPIVQLTEIVRQAGKLAHYCVDVLSNKVRATTDYGNGWILRASASADESQGKILEMFDETWMQQYDPFYDVQILTPQNKGPLGVDALNIILQRHFQDVRHNIDTNTAIGDKPTILVGDKVIQTRNDYTLGIYNGDTGIVLEVVTDQFHEYKKGSICVDFGLIDPVWLLTSGGASNSNQTLNLKLAYALTVHKAQGSEYPCVIVIVDRMHKHMLTRSWLYTAVTRSKTSVCLLGQLGAAQVAAGQLHSPLAKTAGGRRTLLNLWLGQEQLFDDEEPTL